MISNNLLQTVSAAQCMQREGELAKFIFRPDRMFLTPNGIKFLPFSTFVFQCVISVMFVLCCYLHTLR